MVIYHTLITYMFFFMSTHLLSTSIPSGNVANAEQYVLSLQYDNMNMHFNKDALMSFLDCLAGMDTQPCNTNTQTSNTTDFLVEKTNQHTNGNDRVDVTHASCSVQLFPQPSGKTLHMSCAKTVESCHIKIIYDNKRKNRNESFEITWEKPVMFINSTLADITVERCPSLTFVEYLLVILSPISVFISIVGVSAFVLFIVWWRRNYNLHRMAKLSRPTNEEINLTQYHSRPFVSTINRRVEDRTHNPTTSLRTNCYTIQKPPNPHMPAVPPISTLPERSKKFRMCDTIPKELTEVKPSSNLQYFELELEPEYCNNNT